MNICRDCKHLVRGKAVVRSKKVVRGKEGDLPYLCGKKKRTPSVNPVTGEKGFTGDTAFGNPGLNQDTHERCKAINPAGECEMFEKS